MAHYALLNTENLVIHVITGVNEWITQTDLDGTLVGGTSEAWESFYAAQPRHGVVSCKRTSYNGSLRYNYASVGYTYDSARDAFIAPQPFASWVLDEATCRWQAPTPMPSEGGPWTWDENTLSWVAA